MEEVDSIIIETLKALKCDLTDNITSLQQFDEDIVIECISTCLESIIPDSKFPKKIRSSMAIKLKTASYLAEQIKDIGYRDDIGYQTLLYFNETEIRKLFIFLIEKLPKGNDSAIQAEEVGYVPKLLVDIKKKLKASIWIPPSLLYRGTHSNENGLEMRSYGNSCPLNVRKMGIPSSKPSTQGFRDYYVNILPEVTKQCSAHQLIPSLLFEDCKFSTDNKDLQSYIKCIPNLAQSEEMNSTFDKMENVSRMEKDLSIDNFHVSELPVNKNIESLKEELKMKQKEYLEIKKSIECEREVLSQLKEKMTEENKILEDLRVHSKIKKKTLELVANQENVQKLKDSLHKSSNIEMRKINQKWQEIKESLLKKQTHLQNVLSEKESKLQEKEARLKYIMTTYEEMLLDLRNKSELKSKLLEKHKNLPQNMSRSTYTHNIIEIIGNIKKQNHEIHKILQDTKEVQKDINNLTGQIDRSFTISDEMIFLYAKEGEMAKKAYKMLISLHNECGEIVKIVTDIGLVERESRNLQEQIDMEAGKQTAVKLQRVTEDLQKIREENINLSK